MTRPGDSGAPGPAVAEQESSVRLVLTLALAGVVAGLAIVGSYELTLPRITAHQKKMLREAVLRVVPGSASMRALASSDGGLVPVADEAGADVSVFAAYDDAGRLRGYAITTEGPGFQDTIRLIYGFDPVRRVVTGMRVLESRETPGLGDKIFKDPAFAENFRALEVEPEIRLVKRGRKSAPNEVDGITGATISSRAVVKILNAANRRWIPLLPDDGALPAGDAREGGQA